MIAGLFLVGEIMDNIKQKIEDLRKKILYHNDLYYNQDMPEISDYEYDMMMEKLKRLEKENPELITADSPTQKQPIRLRKKWVVQLKDRLAYWFGTMFLCSVYKMYFHVKK